MPPISQQYNRPWATVDVEELRLLREIAKICTENFQMCAGTSHEVRILSGGIPMELHERLSRLREIL